MENVQHEDAIMKMGFEYLRGTLLKTLGIDYNYVDTGPTELVSLTIEKLYQDFTFLTDQDFYIHLEFQTTYGGAADLRRFHAYEATFCHRTGKNVLTYVIYSGGIKETQETLDCGLYTYRIKPVYLIGKDADTVLKHISEKKEQTLTDDDFADIALTPVMHSTQSRKDVIKQAMLLVKPYESMSAQKVMAMLYAFADKFLDHDELKEIKEVVAMTRIGQMIYEDGEKAGMEAGMQAGMEAGMQAGKKAGMEAGKKEGELQTLTIMRFLMSQNLTEELRRFAEDKEYRTKLKNDFFPADDN